MQDQTNIYINQISFETQNPIFKTHKLLSLTSSQNHFPHFTEQKNEKERKIK